jgi:hypothetical protein
MDSNSQSQPPTASMGTRAPSGKPWSSFTPPKKRLVICCDGTWQSSNQGRRSNPSNVAKLSRAISQYFVENEEAGVQICYYDAGIGTGLPGGLAGEIYKNYTGTLTPLNSSHKLELRSFKVTMDLVSTRMFVKHTIFLSTIIPQEMSFSCRYFTVLVLSIFNNFEVLAFPAEPTQLVPQQV